MKTVIAKDTATESSLKRTGSEKINLANQAKEIAKNAGIEITDYKGFDSSFTTYLYQALLNGSEALKSVPMDVLFEWNGIDLNKLQKIEARYKVLRVTLNDDLTSVVFPDLNVYATTKEEQSRLNTVNKLREIIEAMRAEGIYINVNDVQRIFRLFDNSNPQAMQPNIYFIQSGRIF